MQENNTMDTKIQITSDKEVLLTGNVLRPIEIGYNDYHEDHEIGYTYLTFDETLDFYPQDFENEELLHFHVKVRIEKTYRHEDLISEDFHLENLNAFTIDGTEIYLTKEEEDQAYTLIENALEF